ncbi:MAG: hypothetical protein CVU44_02845 [Chloroflexi bacterium HGW-Chloroflexi-6]|nr:MAG: hypothetical protein CVU44_02845 [Chloroflexi bacterium HGW-Chloroflexi-6]
MDTHHSETISEPPRVIPASRFERIVYALAVVALPALAFWGGAYIGPEWQSGEFTAYVTLLLHPKAALFFFPLLAYAVVALCLVLASPQRFATRYPVRFGIYSGVLLALQYMIITAIFMPYSLAAGLGVVVVSWLTKKIYSRLGILAAMLFLFIMLFIGTALVFRSSSDWSLSGIWDIFSASPTFSLIILISASPSICFLIMLITSIRLFHGYDAPIVLRSKGITGLLAWLTGYSAAWTYSIYQMFDLYAALPKTPPDCYIASAAAHGHPGLVGSQPVNLPTGVLWVNRQLQTLKCAELALLAVAPSLHHPLRRIYDILGCPLARRLTHPLLADLAYLSLKPFELLASALLRLLIPNLDEYSRRLYH